MRRTIQIHRSYRKALVYPEPAEPRKGSHKDTKRWCRGKVGVKHTPEWKVDPALPSFVLLVCTTCGRHLDWCTRGETVCKCGTHVVGDDAPRR